MPKVIAKKEVARKEPAKKIEYVVTVGRRKESVARTRLVAGTQGVVVNGKPAEIYFSSLIEKNLYLKPFELTDTLKKYGATIKVLGGGMNSQLDAVVHGLSRALSKADTEAFRGVLKTAGLLTRDPRAKERRKYGLAHAARAKKQSPKR